MNQSVRFSFSRTWNLGNYESAKAEVSLEESYGSPAERDATYEKIRKWVLLKMRDVEKETLHAAKNV